MFRKLVLVALMCTAASATATADVLWDRSAYDLAVPGYFNVDAGSPPFGLTWHTVNHVTVGPESWLVDTITTYYSALDPAWGAGITTGFLHVFPKSGALPSADPTLSPAIVLSATLEVDHWRIVATGLNMHLDAGEYWIGITPVAGAGPFGPEIHLTSASPKTGDDSASYDVFAPPPPAWFVFNPGVEASILIEGTLGGPVSVESETWAGVKQLYR